MNGVSVRVSRRCAGEPTVRLALLHGLGASASLWQPLLTHLPDTVETWTFTLPWDSGDDSSWARERDCHVWLERALAAAPGVPDVLIAHSFAANVVLDRLVTVGPLGTRGLVLFAPFYRPSPDRFDWATLQHYVTDFGDLVRAGISASVLARGGRPPDPGLLDAMASRVRDRIGPYSWLRFFDLFTRTPFLDISRVDLPCLVVGAERDTASYPTDCASLAAALPAARLAILPGCGHFGVTDQPATAATLLLDFLDQLGLSAGIANGALT
jgi:pimeloyl-ACP methyl ester carboxylesterase